MRTKLAPAFLLLAFVGCTSLLGDFEVGAGDGGVSGGDGGAPCTECNGKCVDLTSDPSNCGQCGVACAGGKTCQASACACPPEQAFCGGQCVKADRAHCGEACTACLDDEVCGVSACVAAPAPAFEALPPSPVGWVDAADRPLELKLKPTGVPGTLYECRTGLAASFTPSEPAWKPCDGSNGATPVHRPTASGQAHPDGTFRTEYRYRSDTYRSPTVAHEYYVLHALDKVPTCPRPNHPEDGPHFSDAQYFQAAVAFAQSQPNGGFTVADPFDPPGEKRSDAFTLRNPWIKIPFKGIKPIWPLQGGTWGLNWPAAGAPWPSTAVNNQPQPTAPFDYTLHERSLRHKFVLSPQGTLLLVRRQYVNPVKKDCRQDFVFGSEIGKAFGPDDAGRGPKHFDCEALVVNVHGVGLCMGPKADGTAPIPIAVDQRPLQTQTMTVTISGTAGDTVVTAASATFNTVWKDKYIELPATKPSRRWHKITEFISSTKIRVSPPLTIGFSTAGLRYAWTNTPPSVFVIPTAFAKLSEMPRRYAPPLLAPSPNTKCEDKALPYDNKDCANNKPWLTYLPP